MFLGVIVNGYYWLVKIVKCYDKFWKICTYGRSCMWIYIAELDSLYKLHRCSMVDKKSSNDSHLHKLKQCNNNKLFIKVLTVKLISCILTNTLHFTIPVNLLIKCLKDVKTVLTKITFDIFHPYTNAKQ